MRRFCFIKYNSRKAVCPCTLSQQLSYKATGTPQEMIEQGMTITAGYLADHFLKQWDVKRGQIYLLTFWILLLTKQYEI